MRAYFWTVRGLLLAAASTLACAAAPLRPPGTPTGHDADVYFGHPIADPYRWMETSPAALDSWAQAQNAYAAGVLAAIPGRDALRRHLDQLAAGLTIVSGATPVGHRIFFRRRNPGDALARLVVRDTDTGQDRVLLDPNHITLAGRPISIDQFQPSQDGHYVAVGVAPGGSRQDRLAILDADTGRRLPDSIDRTPFASVSWLPDGRSFYYNRLRASAPADKPAGSLTGQKVYIHHLGQDPDRDVPVFGAGVDGVTTVAPTDFVLVAAIIGTRTALAIQSDGVSKALALSVSPIPTADTGYTWRRIAAPEDGIVDIAASRDTLYFRSRLGAPRYQVLATPLDKPDVKAARIVVPQQDAVLTNIAVSSDALYAAGRAGAVSTLLRVGADGKLVPIKLPVAGVIARPEEGPGSLTADPRTPGAIVGIGTWVTPTAYVAIDRPAPGAVTDLGLSPHDDAAAGYVITETTAPAKDGRTRLPLSIIERKGTPRDHKQLVLVEGYGAYGMSEEPRPEFVPVVRAWVDAGGVMAVAHVRGGGELGEAWHAAGQKVTKQNSIHDFIDCAWYMTNLGYTTYGALAATGAGAGAVTIGGAITQNPAAFRAAFIRDGASNPLRGEIAEAGGAHTGETVAEFGTASLQADFNALLAMDPYQHVKPGVPYPAVLLTGSAQDPHAGSMRDHHVPLWEAAKMAARLQADGARAKGPTLLRVVDDPDWADGLAFLFWQLGAAGFQVRK